MEDISMYHGDDKTEVEPESLNETDMGEASISKNL